MWKRFSSRPRPPLENPRGWLMTIAYRTSLDTIASRRSHESLIGIADSRAQSPHSLAEEACDTVRWVPVRGRKLVRAAGVDARAMQQIDRGRRSSEMDGAARRGQRQHIHVSFGQAPLPFPLPFPFCQVGGDGRPGGCGIRFPRGASQRLPRARHTPGQLLPSVTSGLLKARACCGGTGSQLSDSELAKPIRSCMTPIRNDSRLR